MKQQLIEAIYGRKVVEVKYTSKGKGDQTRLFYPFTVGKASNDKDAVFGLQVVGGGGSHLARYNLENLESVTVLDTDIPTEQPDNYEVVTKRWDIIEATISPPHKAA
jgi:hypothetical protein